MKLDFKVGMVSLVGITGTFPRGNGNYFTINYQGTEAIVLNMSHEDFCDAQAKGLVRDGVECYVLGYNSRYAVYVTDERIPEKARSCWHTYFMDGEHVANAVRYAYNIDGFDCIMKTNPELAQKIARRTSYDYDTKPGFVIKTIICGCCAERHVLEPVEHKRPDISTYKVEINRDSGVFYAPGVVDDISVAISSQD